LLLALTATASLAQSGRTFYIDASAGSNSNFGTKVSPWKSSPGMQNNTTCSNNIVPQQSAGVNYTHQAGDHFIFKGGVTWPKECFGMTISGSGSSASTVSGAGAAPTINGADYYGVDVTWFTGGSFTRPIFDLANTTPTGTNGAVVTTTGSNITLDDIEIKRSNLVFGTATCSFGNINTGTSTGVVIDRLYIHDWTDADLTHFDGGWHSQASICGNIGGVYSTKVYNTEMSDAATTASMPLGSCFIGVNEVAWSNCHDVAEGALFTHGSFHDNQIHDLDGSPLSRLSVSPQWHSNGYESDGSPPQFYNNLMYNMNVDFSELCQSFLTVVYNNVGWNNKTAPIEIDDSSAAGFCAQTTSNKTYVFNNTVDGSAAFGGGGGSYRVLNRGVNGTITWGNNIAIVSGPFFQFSPQVQFSNHTVTGTEITTYGFNAAAKYKPSSPDPAVAGQGANLTVSGANGPGCASFAALCFDASGTPWFGGSPVPRPTGSTPWDLGAYAGQGGSTGPPAVTITSPSAGNVSGSSVSLAATCVPQGSATVSSVQFTIDGFSFGAPITSPPYTTTWDSNTASNGRAHVIGASCTDSLSNVGTASSVSVTPTNTHANGFVSDNLWAPSIPNQSFTPITSGTVIEPVCIMPYTSTNNDNEVMLSQALPTTYGDAAAIIAIRAGGFIQVYNGTLSGGSPIGYTTDSGLTAFPVVAGTKYCFNWMMNMTTSQYSVAETSPSVATIATNFGFRAAATSIGFLSAFATNDSTPDTVEVSNFGSAATLSYSPGDLNFGPVNNTTTSTLTENVTVANGPVMISSAAVAGTGFFLDGTGTCPTSGSLSSACTYKVGFTPPSTGTYNGTLTITGTQTGSPQVINLSGSGIASSATFTLSQNNLDFGNVLIGQTFANGPIFITVANGPSTGSNLSFSGTNAADFSLAANTWTGSVASGNPAAQTVISFTPRAAPNTLETATLCYTSTNATSSAPCVTLTGTSVTVISVAPSPNLMVSNTIVPFSVSIKGKTVNAEVPVTCSCVAIPFSCSCQ